MKKPTPAPNPDSYRYVLTHCKFFEYENNKWYFGSSIVLYVIALETVGRYLLDHQFNLMVQGLIFVLFLTAIVFSNDYIFYRIAKRNKN